MPTSRPPSDDRDFRRYFYRVRSLKTGPRRGEHIDRVAPESDREMRTKAQDHRCKREELLQYRTKLAQLRFQAGIPRSHVMVEIVEGKTNGDWLRRVEVGVVDISTPTAIKRKK
jgi:hypothetical protein